MTLGAVDWDSPCDFCSAPGVIVRYECPRVRGVSDAGDDVSFTGPWRACALCRVLIDVESWHELIGHMCRRYMERMPQANPRHIFATFTTAIDLFRSGRTALASIYQL